MTMIDNAKKPHWEGFLATLDDRSVWMEHHYTSGNPTDGRKAQIPTLKAAGLMPGDTSIQAVEMNEEKSRLFKTTSFPGIPTPGPTQPANAYPVPKFKFSLVNDAQIHHAISKLGPYKTPGLDGIPNIMITKCADLVVLHLGPLYHATFKLGIYPEQW